MTPPPKARESDEDPMVGEEEDDQNHEDDGEEKDNDHDDSESTDNNGAEQARSVSLISFSRSGLVVDQGAQMDMARSQEDQIYDDERDQEETTVDSDSHKRSIAAAGLMELAGHGAGRR